MESLFLSERITPNSRRANGPGSFRFWYASAGRSISHRIPFERGQYCTKTFEAISGCGQYNVGRATQPKDPAP